VDCLQQSKIYIDLKHEEKIAAQDQVFSSLCQPEGEGKVSNIRVYLSCLTFDKFKQFVLGLKFVFLDLGFGKVTT
jgi:hypothetical protein